MDDREFQNFLDTSQRELRLKQDALEKWWRVGLHSRWFLDQSTHSLQFFDHSDRLSVQADVIEIGSFATGPSTWKWAWANDSVIPSLRKKAEPLRELVDITGFELFGQTSAFKIEGEEMAWELTAISVRHLGAKGCYRAPSSSSPLHTFLAVTDIRRVAA
jgi:hypothetical protein